MFLFFSSSNFELCNLLFWFGVPSLLIHCYICLLELSLLKKKDLSMAASSSSSAAAEPRLPKHHVFLSFSGKDTRTKFTSHLYTALSKKYSTYKDDVNLNEGHTISPALLEAIEESEISIIIFSKNYASSSWCLDELVHILKCKKEKARIVFPIFIDIDPSHIRKQEGSYTVAFEKHEKRFKSEKVQEWRRALTEAAGLSGWDSRKKFESQIVYEVVERVRTKLDSIKAKRSGDFKGLVGIPEHLEKIKPFLDSPTVRIIGIWGMGGIGKTALAKVVFDRFYNDFEGSYFAPSVSLNAIKNKGLDKLERKVYSTLLGEKNLNIFNSSAVIDRLSRKKILLVLDDVETPWQLKQLVREPERLCPGSKIIVTSRHKLEVDEEYKVGVLDFDDACKLFYLNAFPEKSCRRGYKVISHKVVEYTKGHPLALEVLGANVFGLLKSVDDWEKELEKLKRIPNDQIQDVLKRSYFALDVELRGFFLDIACFFKGQRSDFVEGILEGKPITGLVIKSLITIEDDEIHMHYLIEVMGRDIVLRSTQRSRLWIAKDVHAVLENNKCQGTEAIEGIYLPLIEDEVHLRPDVFEEMRKLRFLKVNDASHYYLWYGKVKFYDGDLKYLPNSLRYLHWEYYPGKSLPSNFEPQDLVELHMPCSKLEQLWDGFQVLRRLKHINLVNSRLLTKIPDLSRATKLESINLCGCNNLKTLPKLSGNLQLLRLDDSGIEQIPASSIECLSSLQRISLDGCTSLESLPSNIWKLKALEEIDLSGCSKLRNLPEIENQSERLWKLNLEYTSIQNLPSSIENLIQLSDLNLSECQHLEFIPKSLCKLTRLERFSLNCTVTRCSKLTKFTMFSGLCSLTHLDLSNCNIRDIPDWLGSLTSLVSLHLKRNFFESIPSSIGKLRKLTWLDVSVCHNLRSLPELPLFIEYVNADDCKSLKMVSTSIFPLTRKRWLHNYDFLGNSRQRFRQFSFLNCSKLDENAINNIFTEFKSKVFCTATTSQEEVVKSKGIIPGVVVAYPSHEIPTWFDYQSEGSSITIKLPPNWYDPKKFLGFVVSVIEKTSGIMQLYYSAQCQLYLKTKYSKSLKVDLSLYAEKRMFSVRSDHVFMWYKCFDHSTANFEEYHEASFVFSGCRVNRCGVQMLYLRDAVKY